MSLFLAVIPASYAVYELVREISYADAGHFGKKPPMVDGVGRDTAWLADWIKTNTDGSSRILFEDSKGRIHDGGRVAGYLALETNREFIGGPYPFLHIASFWDGWAFGRELESMPIAEFAEYLNLYNVGWIVAHSNASKKYVDALSNTETSATYREFKIYRVKQQPTFFLKGQGRVKERAHNRVVVTDVAGETIVLKYHYHNRLRIEPHARVSPVKIPGDPIPFIGVASPPGEFAISIR